MTLEEALTSRDNINTQLRAVLDEATGKWGIRVNRVELKSIEPPRTVQEAMEKQMRAERDRRATILTAEGVKQSQILTAEGEKQSAVLRAEGPADGGDPARRGRGEGDRHRLPGDPRRRAPTRRCSPTSTCRCCRSSRRATRTRSGSSRPSSRARRRRWPEARRRDQQRRRAAAGQGALLGRAHRGERARRGRRAGGRGGRAGSGRRGELGVHAGQRVRGAVAGPEAPGAARLGVHRPDAVGGVERRDLVGLGERRVVEDRRHEEVDPAAAAPSRPGRCGRGRWRRCRSRGRRAACGPRGRRAA